MIMTVYKHLEGSISLKIDIQNRINRIFKWLYGHAQNINKNLKEPLCHVYNNVEVDDMHILLSCAIYRDITFKYRWII